MKELTSGQRQYLKKLAHSMKPVVQVGKHGLTDSVIQSVNTALTAHELIKVKFGDFQDEKKELASELAKSTRSELVTIVGNIAVLYRASTDSGKQGIVLPD